MSLGGSALGGTRQPSTPHTGHPRRRFPDAARGKAALPTRCRGASAPAAAPRHERGGYAPPPRHPQPRTPHFAQRRFFLISQFNRRRGKRWGRGRRRVGRGVRLPARRLPPQGNLHGSLLAAAAAAPRRSQPRLPLRPHGAAARSEAETSRELPSCRAESRETWLRGEGSSSAPGVATAGLSSSLCIAIVVLIPVLSAGCSEERCLRESRRASIVCTERAIEELSYRGPRAQLPCRQRTLGSAPPATASAVSCGRMGAAVIESQNGLVLKEPQSRACRGLPSTNSGCTESHSTWP